MTTTESYKYEVGLSYASEQRQFVEQVNEQLRSRGIRTFYDADQEVELWGKDLADSLSEVFRDECQYCVIFVSEAYASKWWPREELANAYARAMEERSEYILPARFDDAPLPKLRETIRYVDLRGKTPQQFADLIAAKIGMLVRDNYLPLSLDNLIDALEIDDDIKNDELALGTARAFFRVLQRLDTDERTAITRLLRYGCPGDMPENIHINVDLLRRVTGLSVEQLADSLGGISSLGFSCSIEENHEHEPSLPGQVLGASKFFYLKWRDLRKNAHKTPLEIAVKMIRCAMIGLCENCGIERLDRLDFSQLCDTTATHELPDQHDASVEDD